MNKEREAKYVLDSTRVLMAMPEKERIIEISRIMNNLNPTKAFIEKWNEIHGTKVQEEDLC